MKTKCSVIEDMIPLYKEGLCSEDTAEMVREHLEECESCRRLSEDIVTESRRDTEVPDETRVFNKVNRKMKKSKLKIAVLSVLLIAILGSLGILTFGQITRAEGLISFETLVQSVETYRIAKMVAKGDMDGYADSITFGSNLDANFNILRNMDEIRSQNKQALNDAYKKYMSGKKVKSVRSFGQYTAGWLSGSSADQNDSTIVNTAHIKYEDGTEMALELVKSYDGKYICSSAYSLIDNADKTTEFTDEMARIINYANIPKFFPDGLADVLFLKYNKDYFEKHPDFDHFIMSNWFAKEYQEQANSGMLAYYMDGGFWFDKFINSEIRYDKEKKMFYHDFMFEGCDGKGKAIMTAKVYSSPEGLIPPAKEDIEIVENGCTKELSEALGKFFG
ncbi:MAG: zf-HC2 domain-containing protein [Ruminococcus sp.]|nr:zf-HC2 domain-containing protein [Ruminococcus sp.]